MLAALSRVRKIEIHLLQGIPLEFALKLPVLA
jgi:hypothetical protein